MTSKVYLCGKWEIYVENLIFWQGPFLEAWEFGKLQIWEGQIWEAPEIFGKIAAIWEALGKFLGQSGKIFGKVRENFWQFSENFWEARKVEAKFRD